MIYGVYAKKNIMTGRGNLYEKPDRLLFVILATEVVDIFFRNIVFDIS